MPQGHLPHPPFGIRSWHRAASGGGRFAWTPGLASRRCSPPAKKSTRSPRTRKQSHRARSCQPPLQARRRSPCQRRQRSPSGRATRQAQQAGSSRQRRRSRQLLGTRCSQRPWRLGAPQLTPSPPSLSLSAAWPPSVSSDFQRSCLRHTPGSGLARDIRRALLGDRFEGSRSRAGRSNAIRPGRFMSEPGVVAWASWGAPQGRARSREGQRPAGACSSERCPGSSEAGPRWV